MKRTRQQIHGQQRGKKLMKRIKGQWVAVLLAANVFGASHTLNAVGANNPTTSTDIVLSNFDGKEDYYSEEQIQAEIERAIDIINTEWKQNSVEEIQREILRQKEEKLPIYVVQWGDTLSGIAFATGQSVEQLSEFNQLSNEDFIIAGDLLTGVIDSEIANLRSEKNIETVIQPTYQRNNTESTENIEDDFSESDSFVTPPVFVEVPPKQPNIPSGDSETEKENLSIPPVIETPEVDKEVESDEPESTEEEPEKGNAPSNPEKELDETEDESTNIVESRIKEAVLGDVVTTVLEEYQPIEGEETTEVVEESQFVVVDTLLTETSELIAVDPIEKIEFTEVEVLDDNGDPVLDSEGQPLVEVEETIIYEVQDDIERLTQLDKTIESISPRIIKIYDPSLANGQEVIEAEGSSGSRETVTTRIYEDNILLSEEQSNPITMVPAEDRIIRVGTLTDEPGYQIVEERQVIHHGEILRQDPSKPQGHEEIIEGKNGEIVRKVKLTPTSDGEKREVLEESRIEAEDLIRIVGTKVVEDEENDAEEPEKNDSSDNEEIIDEAEVEDESNEDESEESETEEKDESEIEDESKDSEEIITPNPEENNGDSNHNGADETVIEIVEERKEIPYRTQTYYDENLADDEVLVFRQGANGAEIFKYQVSYIDGVEVSRVPYDFELQQPIDEIVKVGKNIVKPEIGVDYIGFEREYIRDENLAPGEFVIDQAGEMGYRQYYVWETFPPAGSNFPELEDKAPIKEIVRYSPFWTKVETENYNLGYNTVVIEDDSLIENESKVVQEGEFGSIEITYEKLYGDLPEYPGNNDFAEEVNSRPNYHESPTEYDDIYGNKYGYMWQVTETYRNEVNPIERVIAVNKILETTESYTDRKWVGFKTEIIEDNTMLVGESKVVNYGRDGYENYTYTTTYHNGYKVSEVISSVNSVAPENKIIHVGTLTPEVYEELKEFDIPFSTQIIKDPTLSKGERIVEQVGKDGLKHQIYEVAYVDGQEHSRKLVEELVLDEVEHEIIRLGVERVTIKEKVPNGTNYFETEYVYDDSLPTSFRELIQKGQNGVNYSVYEVTYEDGIEVKREFMEQAIEPSNKEIIKIGTMEVYYDYEIEREEIPYTTEIIEVNTLPKGEVEVIQTGRNGYNQKDYRLTYNKSGELISRELVHQYGNNPVTEQIRKGTAEVTRKIIKEEGSNPSYVQYQIDDSLAPGEFKLINEGKDTKYRDKYLVTYYDDLEVVREHIGQEYIQYGEDTIYGVGSEDYNIESLNPEQDYQVGDKFEGSTIEDFMIRTHYYYNHLNSGWGNNVDKNATYDSNINYFVLGSDDEESLEVTPVPLNEDTVNYINQKHLNDGNIRSSLGYYEQSNLESIQPYLLGKLHELVLNHDQDLNQEGYKNIEIEIKDSDGNVEMKNYKEQTAVFYYNGNPYTTESSTYLANKIREVFNTNKLNQEVLSNMSESYVGIRFSPTLVEGKGNPIYITHIAI